MSDSLFDAIATEISALLYPLERAATVPAALDNMLEALGALPGTDTSPLTSAISAILDEKKQIEALAAQSTPSFESIAAVLDASARVFNAIRGLDGTGSPLAQLTGLGRDLADLLIGAWLTALHPVAHQVCVLLTLVELDIDQPLPPLQLSGDQPVRLPYRIDRFHLERLTSLLRDPAAVLRAEYGTPPLATAADADAMAAKLFPRVLGLLRELGAPCRYGFNAGEEALLADSAPLLAHALAVYLDHPLNVAAGTEAGAVFTLSSADRGDLGLVMSPFGTITSTRQVGRFALELKLDAAIDALAYGPHGLTLLAATDTAEVDASLTATATSLPGTPAFVIGSPDGTRIEVGSARLAAATSLTDARQTLMLVADVASSALVITPPAGDGFLAELVPAQGLRAEFDAGLAWSSGKGLTLHGSAGLDADLPVTVSFAGATLSTVHLSLHAADGAVVAEVSAAVSASIGPVRAALDRIGVAGVLTFPQEGGNLGAANLELGFKPPSGVGVGIDAGAVTGAGYVSFVPQKAEYAGWLDVSVCGVAVKAFGLVQTRLPGGQPGYSLVVALSTEFSPPVDLPFGFTLDGVGGLIGVNRTIDENAVQSALWAHHLDGLLFPKDPVAAAPQLVSALDSYFPGAHGRCVIGPLAQIGWGGLVEGEVALLLELPEPIKLLLIGEIQVLAPSAAPQLRLHVSFDGGIDFGKKLAFFDASLHDSYITTYPISGDLAFRYGWGGDAALAFAVGGFNPHFQPPPGFPALKRLAITIGSSVAQIEAQAYLALTSNTLQFGARMELTAGTGGFNVHGWLGFDVLCERDPLLFEFDLSAGIDLRHGTDVLASVHLDGKLSGPSPWHISGEASISLLFVDISVHFDKTWGDDVPAVAVPDPLPAVLAALHDRSGWSGALGANARTVVTVLGDPADAGDAVLLDPGGSLRIAQRAIPLGRPVTRFAGARLGHTVQLTIDNLTVLGTAIPDPPPTTEEFAPGQFFDLSDAEQLSLPSFSPMEAGVEVGATAVDLGSGNRTRAVATPFEYDTTIVDTQVPRPGLGYVIPEATLLAFNAAGQATAPGLARYAPPAGAPPRVALAPERWIVVGTADLALHAEVAADGTKLGARLALHAYLAAHPSATGQLQVALAEEAA